MIDDLRRLPQLRRGRYGEPHEHHERLGSTNDRGLAWLREGAPHGAVVTADAQDAGRGRRGRAWFSPPGANLYVSVLLRPGPVRPSSRLGALGLAVGVGLREGLPPLRAPVVLKWPNDLKVEGRKLGGILCEARWIDDEPEVVVGFGLNVHPSAFPAALRSQATCLADHVTGPPQGGERPPGWVEPPCWRGCSARWSRRSSSSCVKASAPCDPAMCPTARGWAGSSK